MKTNAIEINGKLYVKAGKKPTAEEVSSVLSRAGKHGIRIEHEPGGSFGLHYKYRPHSIYAQSGNHGWHVADAPTRAMAEHLVTQMENITGKNYRIDDGHGYLSHDEAEQMLDRADAFHGKKKLKSSDASDPLNSIYARAEESGSELDDIYVKASGLNPALRNHESVLPIGSVNLDSHENEMFGNVFDGWTEGEGHNIATKDGKGSVRIVHTAGNDIESVKKGHPTGMKLPMKHDQTWRRISDDAEVTGVFPHTKDGMAQLKEHLGKKSANFYTYK